MPTATEMRDKYLAAEQALLEGKETSFGDRKLRFEDLGEIRKGRQEWEARVRAEADGAAGKPRIGGLAFKVADLSGE
ncbi:MAG TPA: hypothetical protein VFH22_05305 [Rhodocyclaceae bacterium]|nr:hypothetical protein [Rhodocyclaceae bacterium]